MSDPARSWVAHLRSGGSTPWAEWLRSPGPAGGYDGPVPGAAQLELVRRLAGARPAGVADAAFTTLADRALRRSGVGRGQPDLPLLVPGRTTAPGVGAPPTDPADVPVDELLRIAVGLLADVVVEAGPLPARTLPQRRLLPRRRFHLAGAPVSVDALRTSLAAAGEVEGGWSPEVLLVVRPLDVHLAEVWSTRVQHGAPVRWGTFAGRWARRDVLPPSADFPRIAAHWAGKVGPSRVHVLVDPTLADAARLVGLRRAPAAARDGFDVHALPPAGTELLRRLNRVLNVRVRDDEREGLVRRARALLPARAAAPLALPEPYRAWAERRAEEVAATLRAGGYPVHGDLAGIAPRHLGAAAPRRSEVLSAALETCLVLAAADGAGGRPSRGAEGTER
ncbi:hypothetical protein [Nocardioides iriomotensis]|uniref:Uncharacterized protein n=1 Tax=Nocardioides iriomotensis TaxID=715784 RepID=A0A4Q5IW77_9ACTN|nr:hypothetical protein [Nocardioides iriomotensis]RYU10322.1 hypothetical protein ETU37_18270 [Nocardioides iriomotensis]